ncbi:MAG TPA: universal stress protein [Lentimicrobium sp.]|nr:universal stress protein [Lentimicrobium sp.]
MDKKNIESILVPTDFSEVCANAANQAAEAAKWLGSKVLLLHVINSETKTYLKNENLPASAIDDKLAELATSLSTTYNIETGYLTREGSIFTEIADVIKEENISMVYLGTHGKVGLQRLTGSFALKVITSSEAPVVVVQKRAFENGYKKIVLPITSEAGPHEKTKWAVFIAKKFNATIHILRTAEATDEVYKASKHIADFFTKNNVSFVERSAEKNTNFAKQVIDYSTANNADLIMIMTDPDKSFTSYILGRYDEEIIFNTSQIPVMCVNPRKFNYEVLGL